MKKQYKNVGLVFTNVIILVGGIWLCKKERKFYKNKIEEKNQKMNKYWNYFCVLDRWMGLKENKQGLDKYLKESGYRKVAIYGVGKLGDHLFRELKCSQVKVICSIDQSAGKKIDDLTSFCVGDKLPNVDAVIVTPIYDFYSIKENLEKYVECDVVSLDEIILRSEMLKSDFAEKRKAWI